MIEYGWRWPEGRRQFFFVVMSARGRRRPYTLELTPLYNSVSGILATAIFWSVGFVWTLRVLQDVLVLQIVFRHSDLDSRTNLWFEVLPIDFLALRPYQGRGCQVA